MGPTGGRSNFAAFAGSYLSNAGHAAVCATGHSQRCQSDLHQIRAGRRCWHAPNVLETTGAELCPARRVDRRDGSLCCAVVTRTRGAAASHKLAACHETKGDAGVFAPGRHKGLQRDLHQVRARHSRWQGQGLRQGLWQRCRPSARVRASPVPGAHDGLPAAGYAVLPAAVGNIHAPGADICASARRGVREFDRGRGGFHSQVELGQQFPELALKLGCGPTAEAFARVQAERRVARRQRDILQVRVGHRPE
mmetsp:Transcript_110745/g.352810  ORF Transcript_110745/g.352810 Transcript_110745/m.352810 type:complete len:251 (+) Transcript_110745:108-860(+)